MKPTFISCEQRSEEWFKAKLGKWSGSSFGKLITNSGAESKSAFTMDSYLVAEKVLERPTETFQSDAMARGVELEPEAFDFVNFVTGFNFQGIGFVDSGLGYGCSPDGIDLNNRIGLEIKCPMDHTHLQYLLANKVPSVYWAQVQGSMLVTGFDKWVFCSYHPELKSLTLVIERDNEYLEKLEKLLVKHCKLVDDQYNQLMEIL